MQPAMSQPAPIDRFANPKQIKGIMVEYTPKKVFVLEDETYLERSYAEFRMQAEGGLYSCTVSTQR